MSKLDQITHHVKGEDHYLSPGVKRQVKDLILDLLEDCVHTMNTEDEGSYVSWDELVAKVEGL